jgi:hypothetical protein
MTNNDSEQAWIAAGARNTYHTDPSCRYVTDDHRSVSREYAASVYDECRVCSGEYSPHNAGGSVQGENALEVNDNE